MMRRTTLCPKIFYRASGSFGIVIYSENWNERISLWKAGRISWPENQHYMKKYFLLFSLVIAVTGISFGQSADASTGTTEVMPTYAHGSESDMMTYIIRNLNLDCGDASDVKPGKVFVGFTVNTGGKVQDVHVKRSLHSCIDQAVLEVVKKLEFNPATKDGKPVNVEMVLPVQIELD
ncbi:MAG: hypothetical protein RL220_838 [Bacteroidota bacterium]